MTYWSCSLNSLFWKNRSWWKLAFAECKTLQIELSRVRWFLPKILSWFSTKFSRSKCHGLRFIDYESWTKLVLPVITESKILPKPTWIFLIHNKGSCSNKFSKTEHVNPIHPWYESVEITLSAHFEPLFCQKCSIHFENFSPANNTSHARLSLVKNKWSEWVQKLYLTVTWSLSTGLIGTWFLKIWIFAGPVDPELKLKQTHFDRFAFRSNPQTSFFSISKFWKIKFVL